MQTSLDSRAVFIICAGYVLCRDLPPIPAPGATGLCRPALN
ncbi:hypothetical protein IWQ54_003065 [Labrenzia sp. EL_195]|nr:hypothetical protein [Labrenzia sp. EL_195]